MRLILLASIAPLTLLGCEGEPSDNRAAGSAPVARPAAGERTVTTSFDCDRANGQAQEMLCGDAGLAAMDREVARLAGLAAEPAGQADYESQRDNCWKADELRHCVMSNAMLEIHRLRRGSDAARVGQGPSAGPVAFSCPGIAGPVLATFVDGEAKAAALEWGGRQIAIEQTTAASGASYEGRWEGQQYGFRTEGEEASFTVAGKGDLRCTKAPAD